MNPRERLAAVEAELRQLHEAAGDAALDETQQARWDELTGERAQLTEAIRRDDARRDLVRSLADRPGHTEDGDGSIGAPQVMRRVEAMDPGRVASAPIGAVRDAALKRLEDRSDPMLAELRTDQLDKLTATLRTQNADTRGDLIARRLLLTEDPHYRSAWCKLVTNPNPILSADEARALERFAEFRGMLGGTDTAGGYGVPVLIDPTIILTSQGSLNPFRAISRVVTITTDEWKGVSTAGVSWSHDAEAEEVSDDAPTLAQPTVKVHEARGFIPFSIRAGQDYPGFATEMAGLLSEGYDELQAEMMATGAGDGSNQPYGILTALDANTNVEVVVTTDGAFGSVDIKKVWNALPDRWKTNARWAMNHAVGEEIAGFGAGAADSSAWFSVNLTGEIQTIRNRPISWASYFPSFTGTTGAANILVVGDFRNYLIADRAGMSVELIPHLFGTTNGRPTGERGWFAWARYGADSINDAGFRLLQNQ